MKNKALGMIETYGYVRAIEAADVCVKAANVELAGCEFVKGGLVTIYIKGDVGAVKASIDAVKTAVVKKCKLLSTHVIPRPSDDVEKILSNPEFQLQDKEKKEKSECDDMNKKAIDEDEKKGEEEKEASEEVTESGENTREIDLSPKTKEELIKLKTVELRGLARDLDDTYQGFFSIERNQIKYSRKKELIEAILQFYERVK